MQAVAGGLGSNGTLMVIGAVGALTVDSMDVLRKRQNTRRHGVVLEHDSGPVCGDARQLRLSTQQRLDSTFASPRSVLPHIERLDDCFGDYLVRVVCDCGACREIEPEARARLVGWKCTLREFAARMRCSNCGKKGAGW